MVDYGPVKDFDDFPNGVRRDALLDKLKAFAYAHRMREATHGEMTARQFVDMKRWCVEDFPDLTPPFVLCNVTWTSVTAPRFRLYRLDEDTGGRITTCALCNGPNTATHRDVCDECYWNLVAEEAACEARGGQGDE